ncbi:hypothetical protein [Sphingomonas sp. SRS2]|uniref:hypothetical protein n=1 Tax=Sphingomonas sp. SRS2 TaxID=133190 RepID=UPI00128E5F83|nr:hypothetical protein [Sphingomonas sp. SRS2]
MESDLAYSDLPVVSPAARQAVEAEMQAMTSLLQPTDPERISDMLGSLAGLYPAGKMTAAEADAQNALYCDLLKDIPHDILKLAFRSAAQEHKFFPTVAELRELARPHRARRARRFNALKLIATKYDLESGS